MVKDNHWKGLRASGRTLREALTEAAAEPGRRPADLDRGARITLHGAVLAGGTGDDASYGGTGTDQIYAGDGNDSSFGDEGNDLVYGGLGNDLLGKT